MLDKNALPEIDKVPVAGTPLADFIPVSCHFDHNSLLTKTGEILQIIEVVGFEDKTLDHETSTDLRASVQNAILEFIPNFKYAVYLHTVRSRKDLMPRGNVPFGFATNLNTKWKEKNNWDKQLTNTLYITIVRQGHTHNVLDIPKYLESLIFPLYKSRGFKELDKANEELTSVTDKIVSSLKIFGAKRLTLVKTNKGYLSEPLFFYHHLIHFVQRRTPLPVRNLSEYLANLKIEFDFNSAEIISASEKQYGALYTLKDQVEIPTQYLDKFLQSGIQFVITQSLNFVPAQSVKPQFEEYMDYYKINKSEDIAEASGITSLIDADTGKATDYCKQQTTIFIHSDDEKFFNAKTNQAVRIFQEIGLVTVREDFNLPRLFWSQLPGNFKYISRAEYAPTKRVGLFTNIHSDTSGSFRGTKWGPPICLLRKGDGSPFYLNLQDSKHNGNTILVGPTKSGKTTMMRFLITQATRMSPRIIYIDVEGQSQNFIEAIGGKYHKIDCNAEAPFKVNPFSMDNFDNNAELFKLWLMKAVYPQAEHSDAAKELFSVIAEKLNQDQAPDKLEALKQIITESNDNSLIESFNSFVGGTKFSNLFTAGDENLEFFDSENIIGLDLSSLHEDKQVFDSYLGILLQKIARCLDGKHTIVSLNRSFFAYDIPSFSSLFGPWLKKVNSNNAMAFLSTPNIMDRHSGDQFLHDMQLFGTKIFLSDKFADKYFRKFFDLTDSELHKVKSYSVDRRMFLFKQDDLSLILTLDLSDLEEELKILVT